MTKQVKRKVELPPKFEVAQLIALQLGVGFGVLYYILKTEEAELIFKTVPHILTILKIMNSLCAFCCIVLSGGKLISYYNEIRTFIELRKKEKDE